MEVSKFKIGNNIIDVKDAQARDDVVAAMNVAQDAQSTADQAVNGLTNKQNCLTKWGNFSGNIDDLYGDTGESWQSNGVYFCDANNITGTSPYSSGFFTLIVLKNIQIAFPYITPATDTSAALVKFRDHTNGWRVWRGASFTV